MKSTLLLSLVMLALSACTSTQPTSSDLLPAAPVAQVSPGVVTPAGDGEKLGGTGPAGPGTGGPVGGGTHPYNCPPLCPHAQ